jgi:hypothetical protein
MLLLVSKMHDKCTLGRGWVGEKGGVDDDGSGGMGDVRGCGVVEGDVIDVFVELG